MSTPHAQQFDQIVGRAILELDGKGDLPSWFSGQVIHGLLQKCEDNPHTLIEGLRSVSSILEAQRSNLAEKLMVREADTPMAQDTRELMSELHDLVREAHGNWSPADQSSNPELGNRLEKYALLKLPKVGMLEQLARVNLMRGDVMAGAAPAVEGEPQYTLDVQLDRTSGQLMVTVAPAGASTPVQTENQPQVLVTVEINNGLPCVHVFGDLYGDCAMSLFGRPGARLASRPGDAQMDHEDESYLPDVQEVIASMSGLGAGKEAEATTERMR